MKLAQCSEKCRTSVDCATCGKRKKPIGRDAPTAAANGMCDGDCPGYREDPYPPHLWPNEDIHGFDGLAVRE